MAEDPGVAALSVLLEAFRQTFSFATDVTKSAVGTVTGSIKTALYYHAMSKRNKSAAELLPRGKQSLKSLRKHEAIEKTSIQTEEIGDKSAMKALDSELKHFGIDYAITVASTGDYLLHYKIGNEQAVQLAQNYAWNELYGDVLEATEQTQDKSEQENRNEQSKQEPPSQNQNKEYVQAKEVTDDKADRAQQAVAGIGGQAVAGAGAFEAVVQEAKERAKDKNFKLDKEHSPKHRMRAREMEPQR